MAAQVRASIEAQFRVEALERLGEISAWDARCCATEAVGLTTECAVHQHLVNAIFEQTTSRFTGQPVDTRPCAYCGGETHHRDMILCDRCNTCYHVECARESGGTELHGGPYFCHKCKGELVHEGFLDVIEDWPLH